MNMDSTRITLQITLGCGLIHLGNLEMKYSQGGTNYAHAYTTNPCNRDPYADSAPTLASRRQALFRRVAPFGCNILHASVIFHGL